MASVTNNDEKTMATDESAGEMDEPRQRGDDEREPQNYKAPAPREAPASAGFFTIYKKGQGYWTRICTAGGAAVLIIVTAHFLYTQLPVLIDWLNEHHRWLMGIVAAFTAGASLLTWYIINKPDNVDFLVATDSEMKKVNWTSRKELIGSTKVVIFFMIIIAAVLFIIDVLMGYVFYWLRVLKAPPF